MRNNKKEIILIIIGLLILNLAAHFLPFERASIGNDDFMFLLKANDLSYSKVFSLIPKQFDRPGAFVYLMLEKKLSGGDPMISMLLMLFFSSLIVITVFFFFNKLFNNRYLSLLGSIIFCLLPNKLEIYHIPVYLPNEIAHFFYLLSFIYMISFVKQEKIKYFIFSLLSYTVAILFYETGFFIPFVFVVYVWLYKREQIKKLLYFLFPSLFYLIFKFTKSFGLAEVAPVHNHAPGLVMLPMNILDVVHHYVGRYMARNIIYGIYKFFAIEQPWIIIIAVINIILLISLFLYSKKKPIPKIDTRLVIIAFAIFIFLLGTILVNTNGGVGGRHLELPSLGVAIFVIWLFEKLKDKYKIILLTFIAITLLICQGNAWTQVVACRINAAVYETMKEKKEEIKTANNIVIDAKSFADNIPFTFIQRDFNVLNTYYGAQAFETWGLKSMLKLVYYEIKTNNYIATTDLKKNNNMLEFEISKQTAYREIEKVKKEIPLAKTVIIDFKSVFGDSFNNGRRK